MKIKKSIAQSVFEIFLVVFGLFVIIACFFPFVYMLALSLSSPSAVINNEVTLIPVGLNFESYKTIFAYPNFFGAYKNTLFYTITGTSIALFMTTLFAYPLSKSFLIGKSFVMKLVVFSMFFSGGIIPNFLLVSSLKLTNTVFAMLVPFAINTFNLILLINFFKGLPEEIEEAANIDGLNYFGILIQIVLPISLPALATVGLYTAVFFWNDWFYGLIYLNTKLFPVMLFLRNIVKGASALEGAGSAEKTTIEITIKSAVIITTALPIILLYPLLQRFFVKGLTVGSVKG